MLIEINLNPLNSTAPFPIQTQQLPGQMRFFLGPEKDIPVNEAGVAAQARTLTQGNGTVQEAVTTIFNWIVDNHTYDAGRNTPQDGRSVFYSKKGSCVGYTNLAIAMLRSLGIPARYAHGYLHLVWLGWVLSCLTAAELAAAHQFHTHMLGVLVLGNLAAH